MWFFLYPRQVKLILYLLVYWLLFSWHRCLGWFSCYDFLSFYIWCHIVALLLLIFLHLHHVENLNKGILISMHQSLQFLIFSDLFRLFLHKSGVTPYQSVYVGEISTAKVTDFSKYLASFNLFRFFSLSLHSLPWFPDEFKCDKEHKELNEDECKHVHDCLGLYHR